MVDEDGTAKRRLPRGAVLLLWAVVVVAVAGLLSWWVDVPFWTGVGSLVLGSVIRPRRTRPIARARPRSESTWSGCVRSWMRPIRWRT